MKLVRTTPYFKPITQVNRFLFYKKAPSPSTWCGTAGLPRKLGVHSWRTTRRIWSRPICLQFPLCSSECCSFSSSCRTTGVELSTWRVTEYPAAEWTAHQLLEAFPWDNAPRYLLRDWDGSYGEKFREAAYGLNIQEILTAPQSPWQNGYVERLTGPIRRECLDHVIVRNETALRRILKSYFDYYERSRTHLSLDKEALIPRPVQPAQMGPIVEISQVGGLYHRYERIAA